MSNSINKFNKPIILVGGGGTAADVLDILSLLNQQRSPRRIEVKGLLDDHLYPKSAEFLGVKVIGCINDAVKYPDFTFIFCIGSPNNHKNREKIFAKTGLEIDSLAVVAHPSAVISSGASIGKGSIVMGNCSIGSQAEVGNCCVVLPNSVISHDSSVGAFSCIASSATLSGNVIVGRHAYIGAGASIKNGIRIGDGALVGLGAAVIEDVGPYTVVAGNPARELSVKLS